MLAEPWDPHNFTIISIRKDGADLIPDEPAMHLGYDDPRIYLPEEIIALLDRALPDTSH